LHPKEVELGRRVAVRNGSARQVGIIAAVLDARIWFKQDLPQNITLQTRVRVEFDDGATLERTVANLLEP